MSKNRVKILREELGELISYNKQRCDKLQKLPEMIINAVSEIDTVLGEIDEINKHLKKFLVILKKNEHDQPYYFKKLSSYGRYIDKVRQILKAIMRHLKDQLKKDRKKIKFSAQRIYKLSYIWLKFKSIITEQDELRLYLEKACLYQTRVKERMPNDYNLTESDLDILKHMPQILDGLGDSLKRSNPMESYDPDFLDQLKSPINEALEGIGRIYRLLLGILDLELAEFKIGEKEEDQTKKILSDVFRMHMTWHGNK